MQGYEGVFGIVSFKNLFFSKCFFFNRTKETFFFMLLKTGFLKNIFSNSVAKHVSIISV